MIWLKLIRALKKQMPFLAADNDGIAIPAASECRSGTEVLHRVDFKGPPILPCNGTRLHVTGGVEIRVDLNIHAL